MVTYSPFTSRLEFLTEENGLETFDLEISLASSIWRLFQRAWLLRSNNSRVDTENNSCKRGSREKRVPEFPTIKLHTRRSTGNSIHLVVAKAWRKWKLNIYRGNVQRNVTLMSWKLQHIYENLNKAITFDSVCNFLPFDKQFTK